jgi:hypothetical protein
LLLRRGSNPLADIINLIFSHQKESSEIGNVYIYIKGD